MYTAKGPHTTTRTCIGLRTCIGTASGASAGSAAASHAAVPVSSGKVRQIGLEVDQWNQLEHEWKPLPQYEPSLCASLLGVMSQLMRQLDRRTAGPRYKPVDPGRCSQHLSYPSGGKAVLTVEDT